MYLVMIPVIQCLPQQVRRELPRGPLGILDALDEAMIDRGCPECGSRAEKKCKCDGSVEVCGAADCAMYLWAMAMHTQRKKWREMLG